MHRVHKKEAPQKRLRGYTKKVKTFVLGNSCFQKEFWAQIPLVLVKYSLILQRLEIIGKFATKIIL